MKEALFAGGIARQNKPHLAHISDTKGIQAWSDIVRARPPHARRTRPPPARGR